ncbi:MAG: bifunctional demethylmenaquinone methyltransferase/2-methoxy-6-polyprenyl-1,4-benzoquinol methylase UbiE [Prevotellaceae bacterium]|jgi:demethylmenaquinone methyltransferase/2-methoxy-6-polyprenyl-1,4-benzoquinol methylase|nr:bifunctional demethylmenaquinone methyltransferase/2-methoxy-6-polyprenyl-1,4-benzoquinol methylase UbiE [Prevotellaceae bacterium]
MDISLDKHPTRIAAMFNHIAPHYDFLNHFLSLGFDRLWRRRLVKRLAKQHPQRILDVATGTGDLALLMSRKMQASITAADIAEEMIARAKTKRAKLKITNDTLHFIQASAESLPFGDNTYDAITVAFGVRNFEHLDNGLQEMQRVLKSDGTLAILELTQPVHFPMKQLYRFYADRLIPFFGRLFSSHNSAYSYLPASVKAFPQRNQFITKLRDAGFADATCISFTGGVCCLYMVTKKNVSL